MERMAVVSTMAKSVGYDAATSTLEVEFKTGNEVWQYYEVPAAQYEEMLQGSIGQYFQANIRGKYRASRIK